MSYPTVHFWSLDSPLSLLNGQHIRGGVLGSGVRARVLAKAILLGTVCSRRFLSKLLCPEQRFLKVKKEMNSLLVSFLLPLLFNVIKSHGLVTRNDLISTGFGLVTVLVLVNVKVRESI